jgi:hypothetical protein
MVQGMLYGAALKQTSQLRSLLCHSKNMAREVVFSINVDHVGSVMDNVALGQVSVYQCHSVVAYGP